MRVAGEGWAGAVLGTRWGPQPRGSRPRGRCSRATVGKGLPPLGERGLRAEKWQESCGFGDPSLGVGRRGNQEEALQGFTGRWLPPRVAEGMVRSCALLTGPRRGALASRALGDTGWAAGRGCVRSRGLCSWEEEEAPREDACRGMRCPRRPRWPRHWGSEQAVSTRKTRSRVHNPLHMVSPCVALIISIFQERRTRPGEGTRDGKAKRPRAGPRLPGAPGSTTPCPSPQIHPSGPPATAS